jgi:hypothetical protein
MSIEATNWALNHTPIPTDRRNSSPLAIVLVGLANHADSDGRNAFPAVKTLVRYTRLKERAVQYALRDLEDLGLITPSNPAIIAAHVQRKDRRPNGWDLAIHTSIHYTADEAHSLHPAPSNGVHTRPDGVQTTTSRGALNAPEPSRTRPREPARATHACGRATTDLRPMRCTPTRPGQRPRRLARRRPPNLQALFPLPSRRSRRRPCRRR